MLNIKKSILNDKSNSDSSFYKANNLSKNDFKKLSDDNVIIINPYDSEEEITLSRKVFNSNAQGISFIDV